MCPWAHANGSLEWSEILWKVAFHKYKGSHGLFFTLLSYVFEKRVVQVENNLRIQRVGSLKIGHGSFVLIGKQFDLEYLLKAL